MSKENNLIRTVFYYYLPLFVWMGVIFYFSSVPDLKVGAATITWEIIWRKVAHFGEYFILAWLMWRIAYYLHQLSLGKSLILSFVFTSLYAVSDEFHQTLVPGRSGNIFDVCYDVVSILIGLQVIIAFVKKRVSFKNGLAFFFSLVALMSLEYQMIEEGNGLWQEQLEKNKALESIANDITQQGKNIASVLNSDISEVKKNNNGDIKNKVLINVPFTSQAPLVNWDAYHEEACEEASLIMLKYYLDGKTLTPDLAEKDIQAMIAYEIKNFGDYKDTTAEENVKLFNGFYGAPANGKKLKVIYDFQPEDIKKYLSQGSPIIVPAAGRELGNPNFTAPGPLYHNLVLIGYDGNTIITNDPGTRKGAGYRYNIKTLYSAIHDFPGKPEDIDQGRKAMIVVE